MILDEDALLAAVDLVGRSGARDFEFGYHPHFDDEMNEIEPPDGEAKWWAKASYKGAMIAVDDQSAPDVACEALARKVLDGAKCRHCNRPVALSGDDPMTCRWTRDNKRWTVGCLKNQQQSPFVGNRAARRALDKAKRKQR